MIVSLTGTLEEVTASHVVLLVGGVGLLLGVSGNTAAALPSVGTRDVTLHTRLAVREGAVDLFGFKEREERMLFDHLVGIPHVGPKLALSVLSTFTPAGLAQVVVANDAKRMASVPGVGKKTAERLLLELTDAFKKDPTLRALATQEDVQAQDGAQASTDAGDEATTDATMALLSMGFTSQEAELALAGHADAGAHTVEAALAYALRRLGGRS